MSSDASDSAGAKRSAPGLSFSFVQAPELQLIYDTAPIGLAFLTPDCRYVQINQRLTEICGIPVADHLGRTVRETVPRLAEAVESIVRTIMETGEPVTGIEVTGQRADEAGERSWITYWHPLRAPSGEVVGVNVAAEEITERKRAEAALRASERQFHMLADSIPQLVWMAEPDGRVFWFNKGWYDYTEFPAGAAHGQDWKSILDPASLPAAEARWTECLRTATALELELPLRGKDGRCRPFLTRVVPLRNADGGVERWIGTHVDISEQRRREEHIRVIIDELSHRTKNLLAVVMAVANQTARYAANVEEYQARFSERLMALAHCHDLLVKDNWQGASLADLVAAQMRPFEGTGLIAASGPPIVLGAEAVHHLGLALHELATNASKHGALSVPSGEVSIGWGHDADADSIRMHWRESGGPPVAPPRRHGFGRVVIERIVPRALNGGGALEFSPTGVHWTFEFPASLMAKA
jgi:PAS domain S-box-containing protein